MRPIEGVSIISNKGNGKKQAFVLPQGMTGKQFQAWKEKNADAVKQAKAELQADADKIEGDINMPQ